MPRQESDEQLNYYPYCQRQLSQLVGLCLEMPAPLSRARLEDTLIVLARVQRLAQRMELAVEGALMRNVERHAPSGD